VAVGQKSKTEPLARFQGAPSEMGEGNGEGSGMAYEVVVWVCCVWSHKWGWGLGQKG